MQSCSPTPTGTELGKLPYFQACLRENFRLYPTAPILSRFIQEDMVLAGHHVPANTLCIFNWDIIHRDTRYFPDTDVYRPERWIEDKVTKKIPAMAVSKLLKF